MSTKSSSEPVQRRWHVPAEIFLILFAFLLNFVWEMWQIPFFQTMAEMPHWQGIIICTQASFGDVLIALIAFWTAALMARSRYWFLGLRWTAWLTFIFTGLVITLGMEYLATEVLNRWSYTDDMPVIPGLGTGLLPVAQWFILPPLTIWLVGRQVQPPSRTQFHLLD